MFYGEGRHHSEDMFGVEIESLNTLQADLLMPVKSRFYTVPVISCLLNVNLVVFKIGEVLLLWFWQTGIINYSAPSIKASCINNMTRMIVIEISCMFIAQSAVILSHVFYSFW